MSLPAGQTGIGTFVVDKSHTLEVLELLKEVKQELLAKKDEVKSLRNEVKSVMDELKSDIKSLRDQMEWLFVATITILTLVMSAFKFLH